MNINYTEKYQLFYLKKAINELLCNYNKKEENNIITKLVIKEDHLNGCNYINGQRVPVTFPLYLKSYISNLNKDKRLNYFYMGTITGTKNWIKKFMKLTNIIIKESRRGRTKKKYEIDENYYQLMSEAKFTLCPTEWSNRKTSWTYRFFEAIMSLSIPILENNSNDIYMKDYFYYFEDDEHIYCKEKALENYNTFINSDHFLKKNIFDKFLE